MNLPQQLLSRKDEITVGFLDALDKHLLDVYEGREERMFHINDMAKLLHVHPTHLSNTIKLTTGKSPCYFFERKLVEFSQRLLSTTNLPVAEIAARLTYDPSNFTKFFKRFVGKTPLQYRKEFYSSEPLQQKTEVLTI